jgi:hypothetical protein
MSSELEQIKRFNALIDQVLDHCRSLLLQSKASEYSRGDRFSNFKRAAVRKGKIPERCADDFMEKHQVSFQDLLDDLERGEVAPWPVWQEKVGDIINYHLLILGMVDERLRRETKE